MREDCKASQERLNRIVLLIAIAYTSAGLAGQKIKRQGQQKYINRQKEHRRFEPRHSKFWTGLYGQIWIASMELCQEFVQELMRIRPNKLVFYLHRSKCYEPDSAGELALSSPFEACDTGRGRITGVGVIGLSRFLISAGVPSVIVSLWATPDAPTASLMTEFYQNLQRSPDKAQALRGAMLTTMKENPNPRDWAAFTLIGESK